MARPDSFSEAEWQTCIKVLQVLSRNPDAALDVMTLKGLVTKLAANAKKRLRREAAAVDRALLSETSLWQANLAANHPLQPPHLASASSSAVKVSAPRLNTPRTCYVCKKPFHEVHHHYHMHCPECAEVDYPKRSQRSDLTGRTALLTGGRVKIGRELSLRMLRDGARVILTTRFPHDAALRFAAETDFEEWRGRLSIYGLDFRQLPRLERFIQHLLQTETSLDILINNAAQTIRRAPEYYEHLRHVESQSLPAPLARLVAGIPGASRRFLNAPVSTESPGPAPNPWLPAGMKDSDGQQVDLTPVNSWTARAGDVPIIELLEVLLVSQSAPFLLASRLRPLMLRSPNAPRFIVNVSAMEGQFQRPGKTPQHPHTNMAKAALNMFTRTSAQDFATDGIWMNSVDTGWITDENPHPKKSRILAEQHFVPPLDIVDGMARIYDPVVRGLNQPGQPYFGHFLKDYQPHPW